MLRLRSLLPLLLPAALAGCEDAPLAWGAEPARLTAPAAEARLLLAPDGTAAFRTPAVPPNPWTPAALCEGSARYAATSAQEWYAAGWVRRPDGSALLASARSDDGGRSWNAIVPVDSLDRSHAGCNRPAPAIAADSITGYVHVVYFLEAPEGAGVFFSHSMDGGELFHAPVPIVYGKRPSAADVAVHGDTVAVAYEDPNGERARVGLALSRTQGHLFENRLGVVSGSRAATRPRVALGGGRVAVAWVEDDAPVVLLRTARWR